MVLDLIWTAGTVLCIAGLLYGAYLVLMETGPVLSLLGKKPLGLSPSLSLFCIHGFESRVSQHGGNVSSSEINCDGKTWR